MSVRKAPGIFLCRCLLAAAVLLGCGGRGLPGGTGGKAGSGQVITGAGGVAGMAATCAGPGDERLVIADQRILRLTMNETLNTVRHLIDDTEARALVRDGLVVGDAVESNRLFPPLQERQIASDDSFTSLDRIADHVSDYVLANFASLTGCATATDACATAYFDKLTVKAYRRPLTSSERARFDALFIKLRNPQIVNGYEVTFTVEEATSFAVNALFSSPQMLWRWEIGDPDLASAAPAGIPLTEHELATHLSFFLTDQPPSDALLAAADAGTLRANLPAHVDALLGSQTARDWLRTIMETYLLINQLPAVSVDRAKFPIFTPSLAADIGTEARKFLDSTLWSGTLTDLLQSRTTFLNTRLAADIYDVAAPPGATETTFVQTTLPANLRSGLLTNAAWLTIAGRADGSFPVVPRGKLVAAVFACMPAPPPADVTAPPQIPGSKPFEEQTSQEQVAARAAVTACNDCHGLIDPYGLALENYDRLGRYRTVDDRGRPVDAHTTLPAVIGGDAVANAVDLAAKLATKPAFTACMASAMLRYAMVEAGGGTEVPLPPQQAGCATADVVRKYESFGGRTFTNLVRATAATPAFVLRRAAP